MSMGGSAAYLGFSYFFRCCWVFRVRLVYVDPRESWHCELLNRIVIRLVHLEHFESLL